MIAPNYKNFTDERLLVLYEEIGKLTEVAAEQLLQELKARSLIGFEKRVEVKHSEFEQNAFLERMKKVFSITDNEINLLRNKEISKEYFQKLLSHSKSSGNITFYISLVMCAIMFPVLYFINQRLHVFHFNTPDYLFNAFIVTVSLLLPLTLLGSSLYHKYMMAIKKTDTSINIVIGQSKLSRIFSKHAMRYLYFLKLDRKDYQITRELYELLLTDSIFAFYVVPSIGQIAGVDLHRTGKYEVVEA